MKFTMGRRTKPSPDITRDVLLETKDRARRDALGVRLAPGRSALPGSPRPDEFPEVNAPPPLSTRTLISVYGWTMTHPHRAQYRNIGFPSTWRTFGREFSTSYR